MARFWYAWGLNFFPFDGEELGTDDVLRFFESCANVDIKTDTPNCIMYKGLKFSRAILAAFKLDKC